MTKLEEKELYYENKFEELCQMDESSLQEALCHMDEKTAQEMMKAMVRKATKNLDKASKKLEKLSTIVSQPHEGVTPENKKIAEQSIANAKNAISSFRWLYLGLDDKVTTHENKGGLWPHIMSLPPQHIAVSDLTAKDVKQLAKDGKAEGKAEYKADMAAQTANA